MRIPTFNFLKFLFCFSFFFLISFSKSYSQGRIEKNIPYGMVSGTALLLDIYFPEKSNGSGIISINGSGWHTGETYSSLAAKDYWNEYTLELKKMLIKRGFTIFEINHRGAPLFRYPDPIEDVKRAVRYIRTHAHEYHIDPERLGAYGHSSGGHLAAMLGVLDVEPSGASEDSVEIQSSKVKAVLSIAGIFDLEAVSSPWGVSSITAFMGRRKPYQGLSGIYAEGSPISHVSHNDAAFMIIQGDDDPIVNLDQMSAMAEKLRAANVYVEEVLVKGGNHAPEIDEVKICNWLEKVLLK